MLSAEENSHNLMATMFEKDADSRECVAARLKKVRLINGLTKKEFAARAGLGEQVYGAFENSKRDLTLRAAKQLRRAYNLPLDFLYFGKIDDLPTRISKEL